MDNLEIVISTSADDAAKNIDKMTAAMSRFKGSSSSAAKGAKAFADSAKEAGNSAKKSSSGISKFADALKRIAYYRFIRAILREVAAAFKEGISNLYQWSSAVNGKFAKSMDRIATSTLYLKNSLGAMLAPLINALAPVLDFIIDKIVEVINWINKLFAMLSGSSTYVVAKKVATTWGDAGKSAAGSAKSAAADIKRTLLGFDEINRLEKNNASSGGGGGGSSSVGANYSDMFEERKLDGWMAKVASFIDKANVKIRAFLEGVLEGFELFKTQLKNLATKTKEWLQSLSESKFVKVFVKLVKDGWTTVSKWVASFGTGVLAGVSLFRKNWETVTKWVQSFGTGVLAGVSLLRDNWTSVSGWVKKFLGGAIEQGVSLVRNGWSTVSIWARKYLGPLIDQGVTLARKGWTTVTSWAKKYLGVAISQGVTLARKGWSTVSKWAESFAKSAVSLGVTLFRSGWTSITNWAKQFGAAVVSIGVVISTIASELFESFKRKWDAGSEKFVSIKLKISTAISSLWEWVKENWAKVALGALGFAIAIATPWGTIATALSTLWADVMASFGGSLAFAVTPTYDPVVSGQKNADSLKKPFAPGKYGQYVEAGGASGYTKSNTSSAGRNSTSVPNGEKTLDILSKITKLSAGAKTALVSLAAVIAKDIKNAGDNIGNPIFFGLSKAMGAVTDTSNGIKSIVTGTTTAANWTINQFWSSVQRAFASASPSLVGNSKQVADSVTNIGTQANRADGNVRTAFTNIYNTISSKGNAAHSAVSSAFTGIANTIASKLSSALSSVTTSTSNWSNIGKNIVNGLKNGINNAWSSLTRTVNNLFNGLSSGVKRLLGIRSPSRVFRDEIGLMIGLGMAEGITDSKPMVFKSMEDLNSGLMNGLTPYSGMSGYADAAAYTATAQYEAQRSGQEANNQTTILQAILNVMQEINDKEFTAEITTSSVQRAMNRTNRRAGTTIVPLGT